MTSWQDRRGESGRLVIIVAANLDDVARARYEYLPVWLGCLFILDPSDPESIDIASGLESFRGHYGKKTEIGYFCFEIWHFTHLGNLATLNVLSDHK